MKMVLDALIDAHFWRSSRFMQLSQLPFEYSTFFCHEYSCRSRSLCKSMVAGWNIMKHIVVHAMVQKRYVLCKMVFFILTAISSCIVPVRCGSNLNAISFHQLFTINVLELELGSNS